jgi:nitrogen fixation/metabolism regulation signal transduction histidine kinase
MLRTRLYLGLLPLLLLIVATGGYAIYVCRDLAGSLSRDLVSNYQAILACQEMRTSASLMTSAISPPILGAEERRVFEGHRDAFKRQLMTQSHASVGSSRSNYVAALDEAFNQLAEEGERQLRSGGSRTTGLGMQAANAAMFRVHQAIEALTKRDYAAAQRTAADVAHLAAATERVMLITIAGGVVLSLFLAWRLASSLLNPIRMLTASAVALGDGDLDREVPELSRDELGQLARAFNTMAGKLRSYRDATLARVLRAQRTMEATLTSAPDPVFVVGRDGTQEVRNPAAEQLAKSEGFVNGFPPELAGELERVLQTGEHYVPADYGRAVTLRVGREDRHYLPRILAIGDKLTEFSGAAIILQDVTKFRLIILDHVGTLLNLFSGLNT